MTAAPAGSLPPLYGEPRRPARTQIGRPPVLRHPAAPEPTLVDARPAKSRDQLVGIAALGAIDSTRLDPGDVALICDAYIDAVVAHELAEKRAELAEIAMLRASARRTVLVRQLAAERARTARLEQQLAARIGAFALVAIDLFDGDTPADRFGTPIDKQVIDVPLPGGAR